MLRTTAGQILMHEKTDNGGRITLLSPTIMTKLDCENIQTGLGYDPRGYDFMGWKESVLDDDFVTIHKYEWRYGGCE